MFKPSKLAEYKQRTLYSEKLTSNEKIAFIKILDAMSSGMPNLSFSKTTITWENMRKLIGCSDTTLIKYSDKFTEIGLLCKYSDEYCPDGYWFTELPTGYNLFKSYTDEGFYNLPFEEGNTAARVDQKEGVIYRLEDYLSSILYVAYCMKTGKPVGYISVYSNKAA
ncbi:hypothetical protein VCSRO121_3467 [Vibrio cholerae]|nr:hypothetical protein VCSRO121_3467 [Vibrio cholerae]